MQSLLKVMVLLRSFGENDSLVSREVGQTFFSVHPARAYRVVTIELKAVIAAASLPNIFG